jgi:hypothetical protein
LRYVVHSHCGGDAILSRALREDIEEAIKSVDVPLKRGSATRIRDAFTQVLISKGWSDGLQLAAGSKIAITSCKKGAGFCFQTGNMARMYADLLKLQTLYLNGTITCGVLVLPSAVVARKIGDNIANASRLERELAIFKKVVSLPALIFSLEE